MQKFRDVLSRWEGGELSMMEAGELLGMSERQFPRYRERYEDAGLEGLLDRRHGVADGDENIDFTRVWRSSGFGGIAGSSDFAH